MSENYKRAAEDGEGSAVLFSGGLDSAVLLAEALRTGRARPIYVSTGFAWEAQERALAARLLEAPPFRAAADPMAVLQFDMRDVFPPTHWAVRGEAPAFDTPDEDVYLHGRNVILLSKASVYLAADGGSIARILMGTLAGNPFPDATPAFFEAIARALSLGLAHPLRVEAPYASLHKADVIRRGVELGVPLELTLSCMQPTDGLHCGRCSKCRERRDAFHEARVKDPTRYRETPRR